MQTFQSLGLSTEILSALSELGYEKPSPIQEQGIPVLLEKRDIIALAQTGTGKTATFALPILSTLDLKTPHPQALVIAPTRELAIQVAEAFKSYAKNLDGFHVLPIYGGQEYRGQLKALKRGVHVVVGTPGRVMDHLRRGTLQLDHLKTIVLDEADEMLKMGFIEDVEWILEHIPQQHQTALFSATMPAEVQKIATNYTHKAAKVSIKPDTKTVESIDQFYTLVENHHKVEALTRFLEVENFDAALIFTRTKIGSNELAHKLDARGYAVEALNGDMNQASREKVIKRLKQNKLDIVVATEVAARGLDVDRIGLVVNYDIPHDPEAYVHRIGRTGRAGRSGRALMLVTPRESRMLSIIERSIKKQITPLDPPSAQQINRKRVVKFQQNILDTIAQKDLAEYRSLIEGLVHESEHAELDVAAALAYLAQKGQSLEVSETTDLRAKPQKNAEAKKPGRGRNRNRNRNRARSRSRSRSRSSKDGHQSRR